MVRFFDFGGGVLVLIILFLMLGDGLVVFDLVVRNFLLIDIVLKVVGFLIVEFV